MRLKKRINIIFMVIVLLLSSLPSYTFAIEQEKGTFTGLCEHHKAHTLECGYSPASEGNPCLHVHTDDCYTTITQCAHEHNEQCYPIDSSEPTNCTHACSEETGCIKKELNCQHQHDETCGYTPATEETPCTFVCTQCNPESNKFPQINTEQPTCTCTSHCTQDSINPDCPVCSNEGADLSLCVGTAETNPVKDIQDKIDALPTPDEVNSMDQSTLTELLSTIDTINSLIASLDESQSFQLNLDKLTALAYLIEDAEDTINDDITGIVVPSTAKLVNQAANITIISDTEYTISYPGVTTDSPLKYQEDFLSQISHFSISANVKAVSDGSVSVYKNLGLHKVGNGLNHSSIKPDANGNIAPGEYEMTINLAEISINEEIPKKWKTVAFDVDGKKTQIITIHVFVGSEWEDNSVFDDYRIKTVSPDHVNFNLFDYWVDGPTAHTHLNEGISEKTLPTCGIPSCMGETNKVIAKANVDGSGYAHTGYYNKGINENHILVFSPAGNLTGGWNFNTNNEQGESYKDFKGGPYYGLVRNKLGDDGYPVLRIDELPQYKNNNTTALTGQNRPANESLAYLFNPNIETNGKATYTNVKNFLKRDSVTGYYKYSSLENFASFNRDTGNFDVYNSWAVQGGDSVKGQFFPFNTANQVFEIDENDNPVVDENGILKPNSANCTDDAFLTHYFGMTMEVTFLQPTGGKLSNMGEKNPMTFRFSGDDDVWIFIDDVLIADIGGIHDTETATIDFSTGKIKIDRTDRFDKSINLNWNARKETTIRKQFQAAGVDIGEEMNGDTFADNTVHVLKMFYMERGNQASNLELEFNLQEPQYSTLEKVDQDGKGLKGITFELFEADNNWEPVGSSIATLTTDDNGSVNLTQGSESGIERIIVFDAAKKYILREVETLPGYSTPGDIHLTYNEDTATLNVENQWETGAVAGFKAQVTMMGQLLSDRVDAGGNHKDLTNEARDGLIIAVPMINFTNKGAQAKEGWLPLYGSTVDGFETVDVNGNSDESYRRAVLEAILRQFGNEKYQDWTLHWNDGMQRFEGTLEDLPGTVDRYVFVDEENGNVLTAYYLLDPSDNLFDDCTTDEEKCAKLEELANGDISALIEKYQEDLTLLNLDNFNRQFYTDLHIPNKMRDLLVQKVNQYDAPLAGAEFTLYSDADCTKAEAKGVTDENGFISFSASNTGNNAITNPSGGLSSQVHYDLAQTLDETTGEISEKKLWLKETIPPVGFELNKTVTEVLITNDYLYADAGSAVDGVRVARGLGKLVKTMARYASDGKVNITLRDIEAIGYKYTGELDSEGFPDVDILGNWKNTDPKQSLNLHYGLDTAVLDYGTHDGSSPVFSVEEGWYGIGITQNFDAHSSKDDPYYNENARKTNIIGKNISSLFTGSTIIIYQDKIDSNLPDPAELTVSKTVKGNAGDKSKDWNFTVTLSDNTIKGTYGEMEFIDGVAKFTLKHNESRTAKGLPIDVQYTVVEQEANKDGYATTSEDAIGTLSTTNAHAKFINEKNIEKTPEPKKTPTPSIPSDETYYGVGHDTGDTSNMMFWIVLLAVSGCGLLLTLMNKHRKYKK